MSNETATRVCALRKQRLTYREISEQLGISQSAAWEAAAEQRDTLMGYVDESGFRRWALPVQIRYCVSEVEGRRLGRVVLELRSRGLSYTSIAHVLDLYEGHEIPTDAVRKWAHRLGVPPSEVRSAAARLGNAKRRKMAA